MEGSELVAALRDVSLLDSLCHLLGHLAVHGEEGNLATDGFIRHTEPGHDGAITTNEVFRVTLTLARILTPILTPILTLTSPTRSSG